MSKIAQAQRLLRPQSIAVIGGRMAAAVIRQLDKIGYGGEVWAVNTGRSELAGHPCYPDIAALPAAPDAAFIAVPREPTIDVVAALAARGAGGAICHASGFAEVGPAGAGLTEKLQAAAGELAIIGPNCWGVLNYLDGVALWPDDHGGRRVEKGVAIIAQSGNIAISLTMQQRALPIAYMISTGNQAGLTIPDYIEVLLADERVTAIGLHIEGLADLAAFSRAALKALARRVPIVVLKSGGSELGRALTLSHTSSLAGSDRLYDALFARCGVIRVQTLTQLLETLKFVATVGPLPANTLASLSCSGGEAALVADLAASMDLTFPPLRSEQHDALYEVLGERVHIANPLDYHTYIWGDGEAQYRCFRALLTGDQAVTLSVVDFPRPGLCDTTDWLKSVRAFARAAEGAPGRAAVVATLPENLPLAVADELLAAGIAPMMGLAECLTAVRSAYEWGGALVTVAARQPLAEPGGLKANRPVHTLNEADSKALLRRYGLPVPAGAVAAATEAPAAAATIGFPVVAKLLSSTIVHKSDVGGVYLNLGDEAAVADAVNQMGHLSQEFLLEPMARPPLLEMILGLTRDPQFGLVLVVGAGGILVELVEDSVPLLLPASREMVQAALAQLRIWPLLAGHRGRPPADLDALVTAIMALLALAADYGDRLLEVDINPLFVWPDGVMAVDAVVRLFEE
ncbi:MAG: acetate--CoA ligase family protein [Ardenticatenales bacterium]|nr:acetate--CoA ligase family protein [Ardenticatenales bacterium]